MKNILKLFFLALGVASATANAESFQSKDWTVSVVDTIFMATTTNEDANIFGQFCSTEARLCYYAMTTDFGCKEGVDSHAVINSNKGSVMALIVCDGNLENGKGMFYFTNFNDVNTLVREASVATVVIPTNNGEFYEQRFSLVGSTYAVDMMKLAVSAEINRLAEESKELPLMIGDPENLDRRNFPRL